MATPNRKANYVYGSAAPKESRPIERQRSVQPARQPKRKPSRAKRSKYRVLPKNSVEIIPLSHVVLLAIACVIVFMASFNYLRVRSDIRTVTKQIGTVQSNLSDLSQQNLDAQREIDAYVDLDYIKKVAKKELGMVPADEDQVIYYEKTESEYVHQNEDIPNK
jgi:cell division protein FtsL